MFAPRRPERVPRVGSVEKVLEPENVLLPLNVLELARSVEEAAVMVMSAEPLKDVPLIERAVWKIVAVAALPVMERLIAVEVLIEASVFTPVA